MNRTAIAIALTVSLLAGLPSAALAQAGHDTHHPTTPPAQAEQAPAPTPPSGQMPSMQGMMPEQCQAMMQAMTPECMGAMQQMMQGMMGGGMMSPSNTAEATTAGRDLPDFTQAYVASMNEMHGPMMDGVMADDADVAFVRGMIPHHQGAIDMARIVQQYGDDPQTRAWAEQIIAAQEGEIAEMQAWLEANVGAASAPSAKQSGPSIPPMKAAIPSAPSTSAPAESTRLRSRSRLTTSI